MSAEAPVNLRAVADYFGLAGTAPVERSACRPRHPRCDLHRPSPFTLVFGGGTALARAHKIIRRMSEDVDFKIVPRPVTPISRNGLRRALGKLGDQVTQALHDAGFQFDPKDDACRHSQNESRYTVWQIPYDSAGAAGQGLRPTIGVAGLFKEGEVVELIQILHDVQGTAAA